MINLKDRLGDREEVRLGEQFYILKNYSFSRNEEDINGEIKHIHYGDIHTGLSSIIKNTMNIPTLNNEIEINLKDLINDNDLIIADASEDYQDLGKTIYIEKLNNDRVVAGLHTFHLRKKDKIEPKYFKYFTESIKYKKQMYKSGTGTSVFGISKANLEKVIIPYINEINQIKISNFLSSIDILIEKQEEYINQLKEQKQGYIKEIFDIDKDDKIQVKLNDILKIPIRELSENPSIKKILRLKLHRKGIGIIDEKNTIDINGTKYFKRKSGDLIYGKQNIFNGSLYIIPEIYDTFITSGDVPSLEINKEKVDVKYFEYNITRRIFYENLEKFTTGTGSKRLHENELLKVKIYIHRNIEEQNKIASLLSSMDKLIELNEKKLEQLKLKKKYYLNEIFK